MRELLDRWRHAQSAGLACVHCSVVETRGSTPQKAGAVMLVFADGSQAGTLGGGCVEAEVRRKALAAIDSSHPAILTFTLDDDYGWDDGLICGGRMRFVVQPLANPSAVSYFAQLQQRMASGEGCTEVLVFDTTRAGLPEGARFLFDGTGTLVASLHADGCPDTLTSGLVPLSFRPRPRSESGVAYLPYLPRCRLIVVGAGHVGQAIAHLAHQVDFDVWVVDDRDSFASKERFPQAQRLIVGDIATSLKSLETDENTYVLIVTRGHAHDQESLYYLAPKPTRYLGLIGSKRKIRMIFDDLERHGIPRARLDEVYAPIGLDIGSQTVPEIAVSVVAQLIGHRNRGAEAFPPPTTSRTGGDPAAPSDTARDVTGSGCTAAC